MCWDVLFIFGIFFFRVSVAGCLGYDVLEPYSNETWCPYCVSVAGCLGYDVLARSRLSHSATMAFQLLVV